jgi:type IV pilus assembly protein PilE
MAPIAMSEVNSMRKQNGVTLMELLTTVAVVGILSAIAIPSYTAYTRKARRADAKVMLTSSAQQLERCYTRLSSYNDGTNDVNGSCPLALGANSSQTYSLSIAFNTTAGMAAGLSYTLTATPLGQQVLDTHCGNFLLNQMNKQSVSTAATDCW